ncbi:MAG: hypothetical protein AB7N73_12480 [Gemmatimonadales bacterium]|jgi:hypothetical protein
MTDAARYEPDQQDELVADAEAIGGRRFVDEVTFAATAVAAQACRWDGCGDEPPAYRSAWLAHARRLIAARRAALIPSQVTAPVPRPRSRHPRQ